MMPRNLDTRVELLVPIERPELQAEIEDTLDRCLADDTYGWIMGADQFLDAASRQRPAACTTSSWSARWPGRASAAS